VVVRPALDADNNDASPKIRGARGQRAGRRDHLRRAETEDSFLYAPYSLLVNESKERTARTCGCIPIYGRWARCHSGPDNEE
jgi:hypothetical protein